MNDPFDQASTITGSGELADSNVGASIEEGEAKLSNECDGRSVWYRWIAPSNGMLRVWARNLNTMTFTGIFRGTEISHLERAVQAVYFGESYSYAQVTSGETIFICVDTDGSANGELFTLDYFFRAAPANDSFEAADMLTPGESILIPNGSAGSTMEAGEPQHGQIGSLWFKWTASVSKAVSFSIAPINPPPTPAVTGDWDADASDAQGIFLPPWGIEYYTYDIGGSTRRPSARPEMLAVYTGTSLGNLSIIDRADTVTFRATAGETYFISLENYDGQGDRTISSALCWNNFEAPSNDALENAPMISGAAHATMVGNLYGATREADELNLGPEFSGRSVWYRYKAATFGNVQIGQSLYSFSDVFLAVFRGTNISNLRLVAKSTAGIVSFFAQAGEDFSIAVIRNPAFGAYDTFDLRLFAPRYRWQQTTLTELFPENSYPVFYPLAGASAFLFENSTNGWRCVEIEPVVNLGTRFAVRPTNALDGALLVMTVDDAMPPPGISFSRTNDTVQPILKGLAGQGCFISISTDLANWTPPVNVRLGQNQVSSEPFTSSEAPRFFRIIQALPDVTGTPIYFNPPPPRL